MITLFAFASSNFFSSCFSAYFTDQRSPKSPKMSEHLGALKDSLDNFALDLYHQVAKDLSDNLFMSPLSISSALLLVYLGAKGTTKAELDSALHFEKHFNSDRETLLEAYEEVLRIFVPPKTEKGENAYDLSLANKAYVTNKLEINPDYLGVIQKHLHSEVGKVNFGNDAEGARQEINSWVEKQTHSKIKDLLASGMVSANTLMVLINAIYFKASWMTKFSAADTTKASFQNIDGSSSEVDLMFVGGQRFPYADNLSHDAEGGARLPPFQAVELPYVQKEMSMLILLPKEKNGVAELERALTSDHLNAVVSRMPMREVKLWLPRFKLEQTVDLITVLNQLGVKQLFGSADLSGIAAGLAVSGAVHKAFVEVNEEGTEAAGATGMVMSRMLPPPPVEFRADHPFIFVIRHKKTGLITFIGRVAKF